MEDLVPAPEIATNANWSGGVPLLLDRADLPALALGEPCSDPEEAALPTWD